MEKTVLCYLFRQKNILMLYRNKKEKDRNEGKWLGIGGHIESHETRQQALYREVEEETGLELISYAYRGIVDFYDETGYHERMYVYTSTDFKNDIKECDEGILEWIPISRLKDLSLWEGDWQFLSLLLEEVPYFELELYYDGEKLVRSVRRK